MYPLALNNFHSLHFIATDVRPHHNHPVIDKETEAVIEEIIKKIKSVFTSTRPVHKEAQKIIPLLFDFRIKSMKKLKTVKEAISDDTITEAILDELNANSRFKRISSDISRALIDSKKLADLLSKNRLGNENKFNEMAGSLTFENFIFFLNILPGELSKALLSLISASLSVEFVLIASVLISRDNLHVDHKLKELQKFSSEVSTQFIAYSNYFIEKNILDKGLDEKMQWKIAGYSYFEDAYSDDEPDYSKLVVREPNPRYGK